MFEPWRFVDDEVLSALNKGDGPEALNGVLAAGVDEEPDLPLCIANQEIGCIQAVFH
jgi:hypothetical protein